MTEVWGSKKAQILAIMAQNADKQEAEIVKLIAEGLGYTLARAKRSFRHYSLPENANKGRGSAEPKAKKAKTKEISAEKMLKDLGLKKVAVASKDIEDIKAIKAKNLEALRKVSGIRQNDIAKIRAEARAELEAQEAEAAKEDPRDFVPKFLHKELGLL